MQSFKINILLVRDLTFRRVNSVASGTIRTGGIMGLIKFELVVKTVKTNVGVLLLIEIGIKKRSYANNIFFTNI